MPELPFSCILIQPHWINFAFLSVPLRLFLVYNLRSLSTGWLLYQLRVLSSISSPLRKKNPKPPLSWFSKTLPSHLWKRQPLNIYTSFSHPLKLFSCLHNIYKPALSHSQGRSCAKILRSSIDFCHPPCYSLDSSQTMKPFVTRAHRQ